MGLVTDGLNYIATLNTPVHPRSPKISRPPTVNTFSHPPCLHKSVLHRTKAYSARTVLGPCALLHSTITRVRPIPLSYA